MSLVTSTHCICYVHLFCTWFVIFLHANIRSTVILHYKPPSWGESRPQVDNFKPQIWIYVHIGAVLVNGSATRASFRVEVEATLPALFQDCHPSRICQPKDSIAPASATKMAKSSGNKQHTSISHVYLEYLHIRFYQGEKGNREEIIKLLRIRINSTVTSIVISSSLWEAFALLLLMLPVL